MLKSQCLLVVKFNSVLNLGPSVILQLQEQSFMRATRDIYIKCNLM